MKKPIAIIAAGAILVLGVSAAAFAGRDPSPIAGPAAAAPTVEVDHAKPKPNLLKEALGELVADGTITQAQADKIIAAVDAKRAAARATKDAERAEWRAKRSAAREQMKSFLEDGAISADELAKLPADHPLRSLDNGVLDDGQITLEELKSLRGELFGKRGHDFGGGWFKGQGWGDKAPPTTP